MNRVLALLLALVASTSAFAPATRLGRFHFLVNVCALTFTGRTQSLSAIGGWFFRLVPRLRLMSDLIFLISLN
jgi:hypothetical protein